MNRVNLLPWRRQRQRRCLRLWGILFAGALLMLATTVAGLRGHYGLALRRLQQEQDSVMAVQRVLQARRAGLQQQPIRAEPPRQQAWSPVLNSLAQALPAQAWLSHLRFHPPALELTGYAATLPALTGMANGLAQVTGFTPGPAGELRQDNQGRWQFTFRLVRKGG